MSVYSKKIFRFIKKIAQSNTLRKNNLKNVSFVEKELWSKEEEFDEVWKKRIALMASYINIPGTVVDFGCGLMWLEPLLANDNSYLPVDKIARDDRTQILDLNKNSISHLHGEVAFLSGILEYIQDLPSFLYSLSSIGFEEIIMSYCTLEKLGNMEQRKSLNWTNHLSLHELLSIMIVKYNLVAFDEIYNNSILAFKLKGSC